MQSIIVAFLLSIAYSLGYGLDFPSQMPAIPQSIVDYCDNEIVVYEDATMVCAGVVWEVIPEPTHYTLPIQDNLECLDYAECLASECSVIMFDDMGVCYYQ